VLNSPLVQKKLEKKDYNEKLGAKIDFPRHFGISI
jgi:hypothetical protein